MTWESLAGWLLGPMDAAAWEAIIRSMGLMALTRNLRNFDEAGVSDEAAEQVAARLADPEEVRRSRQFPYRFLSAYGRQPPTCPRCRAARWCWWTPPARCRARSRPSR
ncbi:TROVE domain-containing protein [Streptomyces sp. NPDC006458]|uniref:TROVE domain-containing protein n=1 Tax=Streptomyces sp. NPDC006458 TaxID=3154302 RepID=UPI0033BCE9FE